MPPKKKGKKDKGGKDPLKDEETRKMMMALMKEQAKQKQALEEKMTALNQLKIQNRWREIMKAAKARTLLSEIQTLRQIHHRHLDHRNASIQTLSRDVVEAEEQFATALQAHCMNVDTLIELQTNRLQMLQGMFEEELGGLEVEFETERVKLQAQHAKEKADILGIMARMEQDFQETEADARHEYSSMKDDVKNKNLEEKHALRIQLEGTIEDLWKQFQLALSQYTTSTEERKKQFEDLKLRDSRNAREIELQMRKLVRLQESISHLKAKLLTNTHTYESRNSTLRDEKEAIQNHFQRLKKRMLGFREEERKKLTELTVVSGGVLGILRGRVEVAERILKLAEMNRKLEVEAEKVRPFYEESPVPDPQTASQTALPPLDTPLPPEFTAMHQFHKRFNKVALDKLALEKQREQLQEENDHLKSILKQYLDGVSVQEGVLERLNPLVVVNGRTNAPLRHPQSQLNITCVEAAHQAQRVGIPL
ncbi:Dynein regulatory complex subunit 2 [Rhizophlyctis rosea]|uniref:Dynein regulatory complex subunit 2 n=1 Tax=Rhizophlyctis rosea TaxID=64517 RepID=A0AAD5X0I3_9FUNG|nr:Dynein regulatory complex subunit 2 [Rhizophlyctis rosea]